MSKYGAATQQFMNDLAVRGALTRAQIAEAPYGSAIRGRLGEILKTGRIKQVEVINPYGNQPHKRTVVRAFVINADYTARNGPHRETWADRRRREARERMIARAIKLLEGNGYNVVAPNKSGASQP